MFVCDCVIYEGFGAVQMYAGLGIFLVHYLLYVYSVVISFVSVGV